MNEVFKAAYDGIVEDMARSLSKPSPLWDLFSDEPDGPPTKIPMKYSYAKIPISKKVAEKLFPAPPKGKLIMLDKEYYKKVWPCGCSDAGGLTDGGSYFCSNWLKRPNSCDRRKSDG